MCTETIIPSQANAFCAHFVRLEFPLRGKIVVVCGKYTPSCASEDCLISRICPTAFEPRQYIHSRISLYGPRSRIPAILSAVCLILPTLHLKGLNQPFNGFKSTCLLSLPQWHPQIDESDIKSAPLMRALCQPFFYDRTFLLQAKRMCLIQKDFKSVELDAG